MIGRDAASNKSAYRLKAWLSFFVLTCSMMLQSPIGQAQNSLAAALQQQSEFLPVREAYRLDGALTADGQLRLYWQIAKGYYLYQHMFTVRQADASAPANLSISFPPALDKTDEFFGDVSVYYDEADLTATLPDDATRLTLAITYQGCADAGLCYPPETEHLLVDVVTSAVTPTTFEREPPGAASAPTSPNMTLLLALGLAFLGGLILNAMPCVFPILSLKVLSFATGDPGEHRRHGLAYLAGVVASFVLIASVLISLQSAGRWVGWGFQLQSTGFVIGLAYLFAVMGLSLSGLVLFGGRWMNLGAGMAAAPGTRGSFFTGVLAVVVASPCTAPFMGSALGYALTQPAFEALAVFAALGMGMAAPMVAISMSDTARRWLPKPGVWMETLKQVMAFPLYLTAVWLLWVAGKQSGVDTMAAAAAGLVMLALGLTLLRGGTTARIIGLICMVSAVMLGSVRGDATTSAGKGERDGIVAWSPERLQTLRAQGTPVFVDVTADWCITCLANEQAVLFTDDMSRAFEAAGVTYMVADWTNYDPEIGVFVREHGRNGIPLYVMYPGNLQAAPTILPQLLTANIVTEALASVSR
ncbi:MAG: thioredoxin family protein [Luminiphilus sp.]|nr:thioredoxin family protein [Luminiphilus sp.]